jgi:ADP-heptose:LPS heptosyltransferase/GT2 family glycosyltransferase
MSRTPSGRTSGKIGPADASSHPADDATQPPPAARRRKAAAAPVAATPVASQIEVDIDPTVSSGAIFDRFDLLLHGRAVSSTPVEEVALKLDDAVIGRVEYGAMDSAVQGVLPEDGNRTQYVFYLNVQMPRAEAQRKCACILAVRTSDGQIHEEAFDLAVEPSSAAPVTVLTGKTHPTAAYAHIRPPIVLYVERAALDDRGHVQVVGWAISRTAMIAIQAFVGEQKLAPAQLGQRRDDVGSTFPAYANARLAGFTLNSDIVAGSDQDISTVRVQAISRDGFTHEVVVPLEHVPNLATPEPAQEPTATGAPAAAYPAAAGFQIGTDLAALVGEPVIVAPPAPVVEQRPPPDPRREIRYFCDNMDLQPEGRLSAVGWAVCAVGISAVTVYLDGEAIGDAELGLLREDVGHEHRHIPMARYAGFRFVRHLPEVPAGEHEIRVVMRNGLDDEQQEVRTVQIERAEPPPPPESSLPSQFRLEIDTPAIVSSVAVEPITGRLTIEGWALARSGVSGIEVMLDDLRLGDAHYGLARQDVGIAFPDWVDSLRSGFAFHCPPRALRDGEHVIQLNVRGRAGELLEYRFNITIRKSEEFDEGMSIRRRMTQVERDVAQDVLASLDYRPGFRLMLPLASLPDRDQLLATLASLRRQAYRDWRLDVLPSDATIGDAIRALIEQAWKLWLTQNADKVVPMPDEFNWSHFNNVGVEAASGEYLLFLNDDIEVIQPDWLDAMLEHVDRPEVAVVGAQLVYPDNKVQHAGMFLATPGVARHAFRFAPSDDPGYFGLALTQRNVIAVTGGCMLMRRGIHQALGGFEEAHQIINNDLDFCLRAHQGGKLIVYTPYASLMHYEAASRDHMKDVFDLGHFEERWKTIFTGGDPYFSPRLTRYADDYRPDDEPVETIYAGHPLFHHDEIKRILVVKVDHIGDFVTGIPAIRRLKEIFPAASIHVLASRAARAFAETEDCIDEFIEFEFFHTVSGLGPKDISEEEYKALRAQLTPYRFDIAVDLRKHLDTRDVLRYTPARYLAGYDYMGQYPYLDISLEWEGDKSLQRKRSHITDDLINLVEAIRTAGTSGRTRLVMGGPAGGIPDFLPAEARALFVKPVVAVHPGVGSIMRQWPAEHFAALIDLMMEKNGVNIVLIGGNEEAELADEVLAQVLRRDGVVSLVGKTSLRQLPELLRACAIYIGNNSGPKHIAAAIGVPTIGLHSGVVDAIEWGPIGQRAVALRRNMTCSPCYLSRLEDCPRNYACMRGLEPTSVQEVAEVFLARPVERKLGTPIVEPEPEIVVRPPKASRAGEASSEAAAESPDATDASLPAKQSSAREAKPKRKRSGARQGSPASAES